VVLKITLIERPYLFEKILLMTMMTTTTTTTAAAAAATTTTTKCLHLHLHLQIMHKWYLHKFTKGEIRHYAIDENK
jgi:hypothetical protein